MNEKDILTQIQGLVAREHELRTASQDGEIDRSEEQSQLKQLEEALDQCWDLLRQRRARSEFGENPDDAAARPVEEVEKYWQ